MNYNNTTFHFTLYWLDGKKESVIAESVTEAFNKLGYGAGAISSLDYFKAKPYHTDHKLCEGCGKDLGEVGYEVRGELFVCPGCATYDDQESEAEECDCGCRCD